MTPSESKKGAVTYRRSSPVHAESAGCAVKGKRGSRLTLCARPSTVVRVDISTIGENDGSVV
jgi:hypothetical protein